MMLQLFTFCAIFLPTALNAELRHIRQQAPIESSGGTITDISGKNATQEAAAKQVVTPQSVITSPADLSQVAGSCWHNSTYISEGTQVNRNGLWLECREAGLVTIGCVDGDGKRVAKNGTYISGRSLMHCMLWYNEVRPTTIGCAPENQPGKGYRDGEIWMDEEKKSWWKCSISGAWQTGCVDPSNERRLHPGESLTREQSRFECRITKEGYRLTPVGCIFKGFHAAVGQSWEDGDFEFYCRRQNMSTCIDCISRGVNIFDLDHKTLREQAAQCRQIIEPSGNSYCKTQDEN